MKAERGVFTTGQVAKFLGLSQQTITRLFDQGELKGFRVPGSKHRRILREALLEFAEENKIPLTIE